MKSNLNNIFLKEGCRFTIKKRFRREGFEGYPRQRGTVMKISKAVTGKRFAKIMMDNYNIYGDVSWFLYDIDNISDYIEFY